MRLDSKNFPKNLYVLRVSAPPATAHPRTASRAKMNNMIVQSLIEIQDAIEGEMTPAQVAEPSG